MRVSGWSSSGQLAWSLGHSHSETSALPGSVTGSDISLLKPQRLYFKCSVPLEAAYQILSPRVAQQPTGRLTVLSSPVPRPLEQLFPVSSTAHLMRLLSFSKLLHSASKHSTVCLRNRVQQQSSTRSSCPLSGLNWFP